MRPRKQICPPCFGRAALPFLSRSQYAKHRGVTESAVGKYVRSGMLDGALDSDGRIDKAKADRLLAAALTRGASAPAELATARRRKLAATVSLLKTKVDQIEAAVESKAVAGADLRTISLGIAKHVTATAKPLAQEIAGQPAVIAFSKITDAVHGLLTQLSETQINSAAAPTKAKRRPLDEMSAAELSALQNELHARRLEVEQQLADGILIKIDEVLGDQFSRRLSAMRQHLLAAPTKIAPFALAATTAEAAAALRGAFAEAVAELACWSVSESELREVA